MANNYRPSSSNKISDHIYKTKIGGLFYIDKKTFKDDRGFFAELSNIPEIEKAVGFSFVVKQTNHAHSKTNVTRGLHAENWNKLISVLHGTCFSALADIRPNSATFAQVETFELGTSATALPGSLFVSAGIANSVCVLEGPLEYFYAVDKLYKDRDPSGDLAISLFDPDLNVNWPIAKEKMIVSQRDIESTTLKKLYPEKF